VQASSRSGASQGRLPDEGFGDTHRNASLDGFAAAFHTEYIERNVRPAHAICVAGAYRDPRPPAVPITLEYAALVDVLTRLYQSQTDCVKPFCTPKKPPSATAGSRPVLELLGGARLYQMDSFPGTTAEASIRRNRSAGSSGWMEPQRANSASAAKTWKTSLPAGELVSIPFRQRCEVDSALLKFGDQSNEVPRNCGPIGLAAKRRVLIDLPAFGSFQGVSLKIEGLIIRGGVDGMRAIFHASPLRLFKQEG